MSRRQLLQVVLNSSPMPPSMALILHASSKESGAPSGVISSRPWSSIFQHRSVYDMQAVNGASQHMEKEIHLSEALGTTQPFLRYFFFLGHFHFQKLDGMAPVKENIPFCGCFGDQERTCFNFFSFCRQSMDTGRPSYQQKNIWGLPT